MAWVAWTSLTHIKYDNNMSNQPRQQRDHSTSNLGEMVWSNSQLTKTQKSIFSTDEENSKLP